MSESSRVQFFHSSDEWRIYFNSMQDSSQLMVIDFTATWCGPCKFIAPYFSELSEEYRVVIFVKIDVDELPDVASEFEVRAMPTFLYVKQGKVVDKVVGANKPELKRLILKYETDSLDLPDVGKMARFARNKLNLNKQTPEMEST